VSERDRWTQARLGTVFDASLEALGLARLAFARPDVLRCFQALPGGGRLNCLGVMLPRKSEGVRLSLELPPERLRSYLDAVGWPGTDKALASVMPLLSDGVDRLGVALDVGAGVGPRLGLELVFHTPPGRSPRFQAVLAWLEERGLCTPGKRHALLEWSGLTELEEGRCVERRVHHVKLVLSPDGIAEAKSYPWLTSLQALARP
jgi:hypothetical protein